MTEYEALKRCERLLDLVRAYITKVQEYIRDWIAKMRRIIKNFSKLFIEETRMRFINDFAPQFPMHINHLQCRFCIRDRYCWYGYSRAFTCTLFFMKHSKIQYIRTRYKELQQVTLTEEFLNDCKIIDLLIISSIYEVNLHVLSTLTTHRLREHLKDVFFYRKNSPYLLTASQRDGNIMTYQLKIKA